VSDLVTLQRQHQRSTLELYMASKRYDAIKALFDAAVFARNGQEADKLRGELHSLLDQMLDHSSTTMTLSRHMFELPPPP